VARITLPSGAWIEVKDSTVPGDRFAIQDAVSLVVRDDGSRVVQGAASGTWKAFLARVITGWSYPVPVPAVAGAQVLDDYPDAEEDDDALQDALQERFDRLSKPRPTTRKPPSPTNATS
jgi:hypothetical protein